jgi:plastocyanin
MTRRTPFTLASAALMSAAIAISGCSSKTVADPNATVPANADLTFLAPEGLQFDKKAYTAKAGEIKVAYISTGNQVHNLIIEDSNKVKQGAKLKVAPGQKTGGVYTLTAGTYAVYCDIPGHKASMNATLTVS